MMYRQSSALNSYLWSLQRSGAHFHVWFIPRPLGMLQAQGMMLPLWEDALPKVGDDAIRTVMDRISAALRVRGPLPRPAG
jgi:hypothetical protein